MCGNNISYFRTTIRHSSREDRCCCVPHFVPNLQRLEESACNEQLLVFRNGRENNTARRPLAFATVHCIAMSIGTDYQSLAHTPIDCMHLFALRGGAHGLGGLPRGWWSVAAYRKE